MAEAFSMLFFSINCSIVKKFYKYRIQGPYSQNFIFFITYKGAQYARVFVRGKPLLSSQMLQYSLLGPFVSYKGNEVFWIWQHCQFHRTIYGVIYTPSFITSVKT